MADTAIGAQPAITYPIGAADLVPVVQGSASKKATGLQAVPILAKALSANFAANSTTTPAKVTNLDTTLPAGAYAFEYFIRYQAGATGTGVKFDVNFSGTVTSFIWNQYWVDVSATASTAVPDQDNILATGAVVGGFASRAKGTAGRGVTLSVDTANADLLMLIEGMMVVTVAGDLQLYHGSEVAASSQVMAGTMLRITRCVLV